MISKLPDIYQPPLGTPKRIKTPETHLQRQSSLECYFSPTYFYEKKKIIQLICD